ncbi:MAG: DUF432 domain-containing protein [Nitrosopumilus sp.]|nr:DUF432 domain-containing protein [Nitrosopumilus sp.]NNL58445.1 DUF432 domain-containing protein [Nitrosopumilus sp.]
MESQSTISDYSKYGKYTVDDTLTLKIPNCILTLTKISANKYRYSKDSDSNTTELLTTEKSILEIELAPILPITLPSKKSKYIMFNFNDKIYVDANSKSNIYVQFPLEIGLFIIGSNDSRRLLDSFTLDPENSRFGLYGNPDNGIFCNHFDVKTESSGKIQSIPYRQGILKITMHNPLDHEIVVGTLVFLVSNHTMYYVNNSTHVDDLTFTIKQDAGMNSFAKISSVPLECQNGWSVSPQISDKTDTPFVMCEGFD